MSVSEFMLPRFWPHSPLLVVYLLPPFPASLPPVSLPDTAAVCEAGAEGFALSEADSVGAVGGANAPPQRAASSLSIRRGAAPPGGERGVQPQSASHHSEMCG